MGSPIPDARQCMVDRLRCLLAAQEWTGPLELDEAESIVADLLDSSGLAGVADRATGAGLIVAAREREVVPEHAAEQECADEELGIAASLYAQPAYARDLISLVQAEDGSWYWDTTHARGTCRDGGHCHYRGPAIGPDAPTARVPDAWPFDPAAWKPTPEDRVAELARAGALCAAEMDRLLAERKAAADA